MRRQILWQASLACLVLAACSRPAPPALPEPGTSILESGFRAELVAAEPQTVAPVALTFDEDGRMYVAEMYGFMTDTLGSEEHLPSGRIIRLEDRDGDGFAETSDVLLDSLVLPRALLWAWGGLLYAEPPALWFVPVQQGRPGPRQLIDSAYAVGGNVEHQPNGLFLALDNWIYNAKGEYRYRRDSTGHWLKERTDFRGQWGIAQDEAGRLMYNDNSNALLGDWLPPRAVPAGSLAPAPALYNRRIAPDTLTWPIRPNTGINRGYLPHMLDSAGRLRRFTSVSGVAVYLGDRYPEAYRGNIFVPEPAGNFIRRLIPAETDSGPSARPAQPGTEFWASTDERFRPVTICNGPDGTLYVLDFHRGILQHKTYLTSYLRGEIRKRNLTQPLDQGRIYRIVHAQSGRRPLLRLSRASDGELAGYLSYADGWLRSQAQRLLIERRAHGQASALESLALHAPQAVTRLHALWTLEGLGRLRPALLAQLCRQAGPQTAAHALLAAAQLRVQEEILPLADTLARHPAPMVRWALAVYASGLEGAAGHALRTQLAARWPQDHAALQALAPPQSAAPEQTSEPSEHGALLYTRWCAGCHAPDGRGVAYAAPPLRGSEWVQGPPERLIRILLHGMEGPVAVAGVRYAPPDIQPSMPGLAANPECTDTELAALVSWLRGSWGHEAGEVPAEFIRKVRGQHAGRTAPWRAEDL
ncbi:MAG: c-type cytochrome [Bacteroidia bacterium]|nr:c-type cytochrome [Bacteroidia bacterium]